MYDSLTTENSNRIRNNENTIWSNETILIQYVILCSTNVDLANALRGPCHSFINTVFKYIWPTHSLISSYQVRVTIEISKLLVCSVLTCLVSKKGTPRLRSALPVDEEVVRVIDFALLPSRLRTRRTITCRFRSPSHPPTILAPH